MGAGGSVGNDSDWNPQSRGNWSPSRGNWKRAYPFEVSHDVESYNDQIITDGGDVSRQCTEIVKALSDADLPSPVIEMLKLAAPLALTTFADERHKHQVGLVDMLDEALEGAHASLQQKVKNCQALLSSQGQDAQKVEREKAVLQVGMELMECRKAVADIEYQVFEATQAYEKAATTFKEAKKKQEAGEKVYVNLKEYLKESKAEFESIKARILEAERTAYSSRDCNVLVADLQSLVASLDLDPSVVGSLHLVLTKDPAERSNFDKIVMENLRDALLATPLDSKLENKDSDRKMNEEKTAAAHKDKDSAKEKLTLLQLELEAKRRKVKESQCKLSAAEEALKTNPNDLATINSAFIDAEKRLTTFTVTMEKFKFLKGRTKLRPPEKSLRDASLKPLERYMSCRS